MNFREMDPDLARQLIDEAKNEHGQKLSVDVLSPLVEKERVFFSMSQCPKCGGHNHEPFVDARRPFVPGNPLPNKNLRCHECGTEWNPYSGLVLSTPSTEPA